MFKVDFHWKKGLTNFSKTSKPCEWDAYGQFRDVTPRKVKEMTFEKPSYAKGKPTMILLITQIMVDH